ncbi:type I restriction enzyme HsdR N-terminal domain-containing protein [Zhihengliuella alba]|uniref:Type I restriction enzyme HsdR N-terminal domain-containing protein n=1 Tax=Zhihengliuella alba TaxID=547018 RepID=A0ABP7D8S5_9MICC
MEISEQLAALSAKAIEQRQHLVTEEATKNALIMPFISQVLGYDVFNPREVVPEFTADVGMKKGEKVDYAIYHGGEIQILIECKKSLGELRIEHASQLYRYFAVTNARIAILTNGEIYQFYTDLDAPNKMDSKPFLVLDLNDVDDTAVPELQKLTKSEFDLDSIINSAEELKYIGMLKRLLGSLFREPTDDWVKFLTSKVYERPITQKVRDQFAVLVQKASAQFLNERVNDRLKGAITSNSHVPAMPSTEIVPLDEAPEPAEDIIETTIEELEGFHIIRAILCNEVSIERVVHRDAKSYFAVILDDNNRKPLARLHFNRRNKQIGLFDENKVETRHPIESLHEIYRHADHLRSAVKRYEG